MMSLTKLYCGSERSGQVWNDICGSDSIPLKCDIPQHVDFFFAKTCQELEMTPRSSNLSL